MKSPVDSFILARLETEHVKPAPVADRSTLLRRLSLDLTGLPPTAAETESFLNDTREDAYARRVDDLLASPHFGERWGRHWLDLARYADSSGYQVDRERPWAWVYRDWVIRSVNEDQPFDQFTIWQLAGDLLAEKSSNTVQRDQIIASGFHRLALSNHEDGVDEAEFVAKAKVDRVATTGTAWLGLTLACAECHSHKFDPISQREFYQLYAFFDPLREHDADLGGGLVAYTFKGGTNATRTHVHIRGDFLRLGDEVSPGFLQCLGSTGCSKSPTRLDLARWIASPENPLTARVEVNHLWLHLFGRGLVATTEDFGTRGEKPSHPELLDWLATEFVRVGWSRKEMIRQIVNSATYRQASNARPELAERDPENRWLARQNRLRLESEILRDSALSASDLLNASVGGKSFRPHLPEDVQWLSTASAWSWTDDTGPVTYRRSLYIYTQRTVQHPLLPTFDQANPSESCTRRDRSDTPLQALALLNNGVFIEAAHHLASTAETKFPGDRATQIQYAFLRCLGRKASTTETRRMERLYDQVAKSHPGEAGFVTAQTLLNLDEFLNRE
ncbi:MAG TPA: DUF1549 and DUF1553 domain-containing protein [Candidatus Limnocylindria bacterium]|nr:DUF1549 and DUF1553 domain-containing protein [Candidatus Limnocylindria bacterium]